MLSKAAHAGRICLSCRTQLRASRRFPSTAAHRSYAPLSPALARSAYYSTSANDNGDGPPKRASTPWDDIEVPASKTPSDAPLADRLRAVGSEGGGGLGWSAFEQLANPPPPKPKVSKARKGPRTPNAVKASRKAAKATEREVPREEPVWGSLETPPQPADTEAPKDGSSVMSQEAAGEAFESLFHEPGTAEAPRGDGRALKGEPVGWNEYEGQDAPRPYRKREPRPPGDRRRSGRSVDTPSLGMDILGRPGHTIVIRDHRKPKRTQEVLAEEEAAAESAPGARGRDFEETLAEQRNDVEAEELRRNIEELRPGSTGDTVVAREFHDTLRTLMDGFTVQQLKEYVADAWAGVEGGAPSGLGATPWRQRTIDRLTKELHASYRVASKYDWIVRQFSWVPPKDYPWGATTKERLAVAILRECWGLQVMEEAPYTGELALVSKPWVVNLLLADEHIVKDIKASLGEGTDIRVSPETNKIKIVATRTKCNTALDHLHRFVQHIKHADIRHKDISSDVRQLTDEDFRYLATLTNTHIDRVQTKGSSDQDTADIRVSWYDDGARPKGVELPVHIVQRLLKAATKRYDLKRYVWLIMDASHTLTKDDLALVRRHGDFHELPWYRRHGNWSQLVYARPPKSDEAPAAKADTSPPQQSPWEEFLALSDGGMPAEQASPDPKAPPPEPAHRTGPMGIPPAALELPILRWHQSPRTADGWMPLTQRTTATFGHLLHPASPGSQLDGLHRHKLLENPGVFTPASPPLASLTSLGVPKTADPENPDPAEANSDTPPPPSPPPPQRQPLTKIILHFEPIAEKPHGPIRLELALHLTPEQQTSGPLTWSDTEKHLYAVVQTANSTALFPTCAVDVDLRQATVAEMRPEALESLAPVRKFFEASVLDLSSGTLLTPGVLGPLPIPADFAPQKTELLSARYRFAGLELQTQASVPFHGHSLTYTAVEAGHHGGRAGHLALEAVPTYDPESGLRIHEANEQLVTGFLREARRVAAGKYFPWMGSRPVEAAAAAADDMAS